MPLSYPGGHHRRAPGLPSGRRGLRRQPSGHGPGGGTGRLRPPAGGALERSPKIAPGRAQYTHLLDDDDGSVVDDIIVWWLADGVFDVMPNASNTARVVEAIGGGDTTDARCIIAVQGPHARARLSAVAPDGRRGAAGSAVAPFTWRGVECVAAGTGYTGEDGVECAVPAGSAARSVGCAAGAGVAPAGLGARDTLRLEAALPLHGHELGPGITPLQAGLGWVVGWDKPEFRGRGALVGGAAGRRGPTAGGPGHRRSPATPRGVDAVGGASGASAWSPAATSRPCWSTGSRWPSSTPPSGPATGDRGSTIEQRGRSMAATVVDTPFVRAGQWATHG